MSRHAGHTRRASKAKRRRDTKRAERHQPTRPEPKTAPVFDQYAVTAMSVPSNLKPNH